MRFAFVTTNLAGGGAEKALLKTAAALTAHGHVADIWLLENRIDHVLPQGITVRNLGPAVGHGWLHKRLSARRLRRDVRFW